MAGEFQYDVFISHSSKDKAVVRPLAERLHHDARHSRAEIGCQPLAFSLQPLLSAFGSDWTQLEAGTFRFRDALNKEHRFIPLWPDNAPVKSSPVQFLYINWQLQSFD